MRAPVILTVGQTWQSSDPRRLSWFDIEGIVGNDIIVRRQNGRLSTIARHAFHITGPRGYMRVR